MSATVPRGGSGHALSAYVESVVGSGQNIDRAPVTLRRFPYPFHAALAICSDIHGTTTLERFLFFQELPNTKRDTAMGPGVALEIGNSFFPYAPDDSFAYFSSRSVGREIIETFIKAGYIDCLHSYDDGARSRANALHDLAEAYRGGDIYVTTTSRLLNYYVNHRYLQWSCVQDKHGWTEITIRGVADPIAGPRLPKLTELQGITFYVPDRHRAQLYLGGHLVSSLVRNAADYTGRESISIPRTYLTYPLPISQRTSFPVVRPVEGI